MPISLHKFVPPAGSPLRRAIVRFKQVTFLHVWFPHLLAALGVGLLGLFNLVHGLDLLAPKFGQLLTTKPVLTLTQLSAWHGVSGIPQTIVGAVMLLMAGGLAIRSRFAWVVALLLSAAALALVLHRTGMRWSFLASYNLILMLGLLYFHRGFARSSVAAGTMFSIISILLLLGYAVLGTFILGKGFSPPVKTLTTALYFSAVTLSTVGYGDIVPKSDDARLFVVSLIVLGITVFATSLSAVIVPLVNSRIGKLLSGEKQAVKKDHYIIVGDNALVHNTYRELKSRRMPVTVIVPQQPEAMWMDAGDLVVGDASDVEVLRNAGAADALAILALRADDSENAFIVLAAKEVGGSAKTVAAVKNSKNLARVRRVTPDIIIAPDILGGELLAMALSGEHLAADDILKRLFVTQASAAGGKAN